MFTFEFNIISGSRVIVRPPSAGGSSGWDVQKNFNKKLVLGDAFALKYIR